MWDSMVCQKIDVPPSVPFLFWASLRNSRKTGVLSWDILVWLAKRRMGSKRALSVVRVRLIDCREGKKKYSRKIGTKGATGQILILIFVNFTPRILLSN